MEMPNGPPSNASRGSCSSNAARSFPRRPVDMYGGLQTIRSTAPANPSAPSGANRSPWCTLTRPWRARWSTLRAESSTQGAVTSHAQTRARGTPAASAQARLPDPQHMSIIRSGPSPGVSAARASSNRRAVQPSSSVSGRGTSTPGAARSSMPMNIWRPVRYAGGTPAAPGPLMTTPPWSLSRCWSWAILQRSQSPWEP